MWVIYHALVVGKELGNGYGHLVQGNGLDDDDDDDNNDGDDDETWKTILFLYKYMYSNYPNCV